MKNKRVLTAIFVIMALCFFGCSSSTNTSSNNLGGGSSAESSSTSDLLANVNSWLYQLQDIDVSAVGSSQFDLAVIDYSSDGSDDGSYSSADLTTMKGSGNSEKLVIAYMSIGEAEDYRFYFDADADYMDAENPEFLGNFKIHYWEDAWQAIIDSYVDRLVAAGFDGAYLDIIDAYEYFGPGGDSGLNRLSAADDMANFVIHISEYARAQNEHFLIFPQNGAGIINDTSLPEEYLAAIDGIGAEDTFYFGDATEDNDLDEQISVIDNLDAFNEAGKLVLSVDYLTQIDKIDDFYERAAAKGYVPYASVRDLNVLTVNEGHEPD